MYQRASSAIVVGLVINLLLGVVKAIAGTVANSFALVADSVNSLGDSITSVVVLIALRIAQRDPDPEHPYGHTRAEAIAALCVALLVVISALVVGWEALSRLKLQHAIPPAWALWLAGCNVVIKEGLYQYKSRTAAKTGSTALLAVAWDHRSDAFCAFAVLVGLAIVRVGGQDYIAADEVAALVIVAVILVLAGRLLWRCVNELLDGQAEAELVDAIRECAAAVAQVRDIEKLRVRRSGLECLVDIHVQVDPELNVRTAHSVGHAVKDTLMSEFREVRDVLVHIEPFEPPTRR